VHIPKAWAKASAETKAPDGRPFALAVWGWGEDALGARSEAARRLERLVGRVRRGEPFGTQYAYSTRPPREEILQTMATAPDDAPFAVVTRNRYGARVLNAARLLFLDVDLPPPGLGERLKRFFLPSSPGSESIAAGRLREALRRYGKATFRLYRTASGLRAIAVDRDFDPAGEEAQALMKDTGTDPAFVRLCLAQKSFRARLTPKPWRADCPLPPGEHPRTDEAARKEFAAWLASYESTSARYATCRYLETVGSGSPRAEAKKLIELHDERTRCNDALPLA
jgi:hypothetical protein